MDIHRKQEDDFTWFTSSWMLRLLRSLLEISSGSTAAGLLRAPGCDAPDRVAPRGGLWVPIPGPLLICIWWVMDLGGNCWLKCSCACPEAEGWGGCWLGLFDCCCCCCVVGVFWWSWWGMWDLWNDWGFVWGRREGVGKGGFPWVAEEDSQCWFWSCELWEPVGDAEPEDPSEETLSMPCPWKFWYK